VDLLARDRIRLDLPETVPVLWILQISVLVSRQIRFGTSNVAVFFQVIQLGIRGVLILARLSILRAVFRVQPRYTAVHTYVPPFETFRLH
jgi:hypothetical protein